MDHRGATGRGQVIVVGLGPAGASLLTAEARAALTGSHPVRLRTVRHPAVAELPELAGVESFDHLYEAAGSLDEVYREIVTELIRLATTEGAVVYAVPGSPVVAERTVELLREADPEVEVDVRPAMSFLDLAWTRLGVDPLASGVRTIDGHRFAVEAAGEGGWHDLDREIVPDHLTSVFIPELIAPVAGEVQRFVELVATLRRECPWDQQQTHESLRRHLLEEAYEVLDALSALTDATSGRGGEADDAAEADAYTHLEEELGDLLFQVVFHATLATEDGQFTLADVARGIHDKLYARHPHVFGEVPDGLAPGDTAAEVVANWEQLKKSEKGRASVFEGIPADLPSLLLALKVQKKAASLGDLGEDLPSPGSWDHVVTLAQRSPTPESVGDLLFAVVNLARHADIDPEVALRAAAHRYRDLVRPLER